MSSEQSKVLRIFNKEFLYKLFERDNAKPFGIYEKLNSLIRVKFICNCGIQNEKVFIKIADKGGAFCEKCTKINTRIKIEKTNMEKYGVIAPLQNKDILKKTQTTNMERYGGIVPTLDPKISQKRNETNLKKYGTKCSLRNPECMKKTLETTMRKFGTTHTSKSKEVMKKVEETNKKRYGGKAPASSKEVLNKMKETTMQKYGKEHYTQTEEYKIRSEETNLKKYGTKHSSQNLEVMEKTQKSSKRYKDYILSSGKIIRVQGYEPWALDELVKIYKEEDILTVRSDVPQIKYEIEKKEKMYFPDIFIKSENKIIEVKSTWTYKCKEDNVQFKANACKKLGYNYEIWIYDYKKNKTIVL
jgi:hypothetical protein